MKIVATIIAAMCLTSLAMAADKMPDNSYKRAQEEAKRTGLAQPVLYVFGDRDSQAVAQFMAILQAANVGVPHIVDLEKVDDETLAEIRKSITEFATTPFLQTIHATESGMGPFWREMRKTERITVYEQWLAKSKAPLKARVTQTSSRSRSGSAWGSGSSSSNRSTSGSTGRSRVFRRRSGGG